jgi:chemotaxis response regulator CheB
VGRRWGRRLRILADVPLITRRRSPIAAPTNTPQSARRPPRQVKLVVVGASTGGPPALHKILDALSEDPAWPLVVVQHITPGFTLRLASWLAQATGRTVEVVENMVKPVAGVTYLACEHRHLVLQGSFLVARAGEPQQGQQPSVDVLFESVAKSPVAAATVGVLLTGMGQDGARGLVALRQAGAWTVALDEDSSVVYGMPKAAVDLDGACEVASLEKIGRYLQGFRGR